MFLVYSLNSNSIFVFPCFSNGFAFDLTLHACHLGFTQCDWLQHPNKYMIRHIEITGMFQILSNISCFSLMVDVSSMRNQKQFLDSQERNWEEGFQNDHFMVETFPLVITNNCLTLGSTIWQVCTINRGFFQASDQSQKGMAWNFSLVMGKQQVFVIMNSYNALFYIGYEANMLSTTKITDRFQGENIQL